ncbi:MAG: 2-oxoglutarate dehydrogenase E1 subunit family protein, partial [Thermomicrobiales bacterium]
MSDLGAFWGPNAGYVLDLYDQYLADPASVEPEMRAWFATLDPAAVEAAAVQPSRGAATASAAASGKPSFSVPAVVGAAALAQSIREFG